MRRSKARRVDAGHGHCVRTTPVLTASPGGRPAGVPGGDHCSCSGVLLGAWPDSQSPTLSGTRCCVIELRSTRSRRTCSAWRCVPALSPSARSDEWPAISMQAGLASSTTSTSIEDGVMVLSLIDQGSGWVSGFPWSRHHPRVSVSMSCTTTT